MTNTIDISLDLETWGTEPGDDLRSIGACVFDPDTGTIASALHYADTSGAFEGGRNEQTFYINTENPAGRWRDGEFVPELATGHEDYRRYPLTRNPATVKWWNDPARAEANAQLLINQVELRTALLRFHGWLNDVTRTFRPIEYPSRMEIMHGESIDIRAYGRVHDQPVPLHKWTGLRLWSHGAAFDPPILAAAYKACGLPVPWHYRAPRDTRTAFDMAGIDDHSAHLTALATGTYHNALDDAVTQARAVCAAYERAGRTDPPTACKTEADCFIIDAAMQHGFECLNDDATIYKASDGAILSLVNGVQQHYVAAHQPITRDVVTHRDVWRRSLVERHTHAASLDDREYWEHELKAFDRTFDALANHPLLEK